MSGARSSPPSRTLSTLFDVGTLGASTDRELLEIYRSRRGAAAEEAFRVLVERHGPMVLRLCRGVLRDSHDVEDAFQATFLVLVRRSESIRNREAVGPWLLGVASRVSRRARSLAARRQLREKPSPPDLDHEAPADKEPRELEQALHEEIERLPVTLRSALILCCLGDQSYERAAQALGVSEPTLRGRLHRARRTLEARLRRRDLGPAGLLGAILSPGKVARLPSRSLIDSTVHFAVRWRAVAPLDPGLVSGTIQSLAQGAILTMYYGMMKSAMIPALLLSGVVGTAVLANQGRQVESDADAARKAVPFPETIVIENPSPEIWRKVAEQQIKRVADAQALEEQSRTILTKLKGTYDVAFPDGAELDSVLKSIREATRAPGVPGIPIYVSPLGLQEANQTMSSIATFDGKKTPLGVALRRALRPLGLSYHVKDGLLVIDSRLAALEERMESLEDKLDQLLDSAETGERLWDGVNKGGLQRRNPPRRRPSLPR